MVVLLIYLVIYRRNVLPIAYANFRNGGLTMNNCECFSKKHSDWVGSGYCSFVLCD